MYDSYVLEANIIISLDGLQLALVGIGCHAVCVDNRTIENNMVAIGQVWILAQKRKIYVAHRLPGYEINLVGLRLT